MPTVDPSGNMIVTLADLYEDQREIRQAMTTGFTGISAQLSSIGQNLIAITETQNGYKVKLEDHESRLRNLERFRNAFPAVLLTSVLSLIAVIADVVVRIINHG